MKTVLKIPFLITTLSLIIAGCATNSEKEIKVTTPTPVVLTNDYPTHDRVEYVLNCVAQHGGLSYINQYACGCKLDKIAEKLSFNDFEAAKTFSYLKSMAGDNGGMARDPKQSKDLRKQLKEAEDFAEKSCFVK